MRAVRVLFVSSLLVAVVDIAPSCGTVSRPCHAGDPANPQPGPLARRVMCNRPKGHARAGWPLSIACWASPSNTPHYCGGYVGGDTAIGGCPPTAEQGTWGWDYRGLYLPKRIWLGWSNGARQQGGAGAYRTDGPHFLKHEYGACSHAPRAAALCRFARASARCERRPTWFSVAMYPICSKSGQAVW
jgi:hypothetical protein